MVNNEKSYDDGKNYDIEYSNSINYTNTKGYYEFITKLLIAISKSRLMRDYHTWLDCVDAFYSATLPYWRKDQEIEKYEALYIKVNNLLNNQERSKTDGVKNSITNNVNGVLREMTKLVMINTKHIHIRDDADTDYEDEETWFDD